MSNSPDISSPDLSPPPGSYEVVEQKVVDEEQETILLPPPVLPDPHDSPLSSPPPATSSTDVSPSKRPSPSKRKYKSKRQKQEKELRDFESSQYGVSKPHPQRYVVREPVSLHSPKQMNIAKASDGAFKSVTPKARSPVSPRRHVTVLAPESNDGTVEILPASMNPNAIPFLQFNEFRKYLSMTKGCVCQRQNLAILQLSVKKLKQCDLRTIPSLEQGTIPDDATRMVATALGQGRALKTNNLSDDLTTGFGFVARSYSHSSLSLGAYSGECGKYDETKRIFTICNYIHCGEVHQDMFRRYEQGQEHVFFLSIRTANSTSVFNIMPLDGGCLSLLLFLKANRPKIVLALENNKEYAYWITTPVEAQEVVNSTDLPALEIATIANVEE